MLKHLTFKAFTEITKTATITVDQHGGRAKCLQRLVRLDMPVLTTVALSFETVRHIAQGKMTDVEAILDFFGETPLVSVRPSAEGADWGGPGAILNIGMNERRHAVMVQRRGEDAANAIYLRFIHTYAVQVAHLDADLFPPVQRPARSDVAEALRIYEMETDEPFPEEPAEQLAGVLRSMARAWEGTSARLLRKARGAPENAGLGLVVQRMALGVGKDESGSGVMQFINSTTGKAQITGRYMSQSQGRDALALKHAAIYLTRDPRGPSLEELAPEIFDQLVGLGELARAKLREEMQIEFVIQESTLCVIDAVRVRRTARANVEIVVGLAQDRIITRDEALLRVPPRSLNELMHWQVNPEAERRVLAGGIAASPGAAVGKLVFSSTRAQALAAQGERHRQPGAASGDRAAEARAGHGPGAFPAVPPSRDRQRGRRTGCPRCPVSAKGGVEGNSGPAPDAVAMEQHTPEEASAMAEIRLGRRLQPIRASGMPFLLRVSRPDCQVGTGAAAPKAGRWRPDAATASGAGKPKPGCASTAHGLPEKSARP
ncbi:hypothetical protein [Mangrovicoccus ximenensis]|uniref:hypothetical protein n=1 Tax=Mangrovicoccus ximenensis TaxID=1911570 RepID=UPI000D3A7B3E